MCCSCYRMPQNAFFPRTHDLLVSLKRKRKKRKKEKKKTQRHFFSTLHPLFPVIFATATVLAFVLLLNSRFNFPCYTRRRMQRLLRYRPGSVSCDLSRLLARKIKRTLTCANQLRWKCSFRAVSVTRPVPRLVQVPAQILLDLKKIVVRLNVSVVFLCYCIFCLRILVVHDTMRAGLYLYTCVHLCGSVC